MDIYRHSESEEMDGELNLEKLNDFSIDQVFYYYVPGCDDAHGSMILTMSDGTVVLHDLSHCSCFGPMDNLGFNIANMKYSTIDKLVEDQKDFRMSCEDDHYGMRRVIALFKETNKEN